MLQKKIAGFMLDLKQRLGKGACGEVYLAVDTSTNKFVAVKQISMQNKNQQQYDKTFASIQNEIKIMKSITNTNVVALIDVQRTPNNLYLVMELCNQGTLEEYIRNKCQDKNIPSNKKQANQKINYLSETEAKLFIKQIVNGFRELYPKKIVHRDLKLQNLMIHDGEVKIADFGFSKVIECGMDEALLKTYAGSPLYMSIQILKQTNYSSKCDVWSLGIIFYEILIGQPPWIAVSIPDLISKIDNIPIKFPGFPFVSQETRILIQRMLARDEGQRIGWEEIFNHNYFSQSMEIEEQMNWKDTMNNINGKYKNDGLRRSNAKKNFYFEKNEVIQNVQHAAKQQEKMQKIFEMPVSTQSPNLISQSPIKSSQSPLQQKSTQQSYVSNVSDQNQTKNRIFDQRPDRSRSPSPMNRKDSGVNQDPIYQIFKNNQMEVENKKMVQQIGEWIIHRRNKSVFMNTLSQKWFDLYDNGVLKEHVNQASYYRFLFVLTKYQTIIFFKMNCRLENKQLEENFTKFTRQQWSVFTKSQEYKTAASQIRNDFYVVRGFLVELIERAKEALKLQNQNDGQKDDINLKVFNICNMDMVNKTVFDPIFYENINFVLSVVKETFTNGIKQLKNQDELNKFMLDNKDMAIFGTHLNNALKIKSLFKFNNTKPVDFFKYYEEIDNERPERLAHLLGVI